MKANELFEKIKSKQVLGSLDREVDDVTTDSRTAKAGSIFVASKGYTVDSHKFCQNVVEPVSYTHLRAHETREDLVCRLLLEKKKK